MKAKKFSLRRDFAPDEARGEDTPGVSPWELHFLSSSSFKRKIERKIRPAKIGITIIKALTGSLMTITTNTVKATIRAANFAVFLSSLFTISFFIVYRQF